MFNVKDALDEVSEKTLEEIQRATAYTWASRAIACYKIAKTDNDAAWVAHWTAWGDEYKHEAVEHAALVDDEKFFKEINDAVHMRGDDDVYE